MLPDSSRAAAGPPALEDDHVLLADRRVEIRRGFVRGALRHEFGLDDVTFTGWAAARNDETVTVHFFAEGEHVLEVACDRPAEEPGLEDTPGRRGFAATVPLAVLRPAERAVTAVALPAFGYASYLAGDGSGASLFPSLPLRDRSDFSAVVQSPVTRLDDAIELVYLARWGLARYEPGKGEFAAAICVLGYRILEHPDELRHLAGEFWDAVGRWNERGGTLPDGATMRWHISLNTVAGYLGLMEGDLEHAARQFRSVADRYGDLYRSPISAHNVSIATFLAGWLSHKSGDREQAVDYFGRALTVVRMGLQVQPIDSNFYVWNENARMSYLGQQALWMIGYLDPDFAKKGRIPLDERRFTLKPILVRVPELFNRLPDELKTL